jgi:hypothetical protein
MKRSVLACAVAAGVMALCAPASAAPPQPAAQQFTLPAGAACTFPIDVSLTGKGKIIDLNGGRRTITAPGQKVTFTNTDNGMSAAYVITGVFHNETQPDGNVVTKATGRNALTDPVAGFVITAGNFSYTTAPDGSNVVPLHGTGTTTDICAALS